MKAIVQSEYGSADVLRLAEVAKPVCDDESVLVKVEAASVNAGDWHLMTGDPFFLRLMFGGLLKPKIKTLGFDVAGRVEAVGKNVTQFRSGDEVFGDISDYGFGAFAEYVCVPAAALALKPATLAFEPAAAVPAAAVTALQSLRDCGQVQPGQRVLINGASGGVGSFAVQIAKELGAEVTAVCSTSKVDMVRSLNPDHIIDYTKEDITQNGQQYDLILDAAAYRSVFDYFPTLSSEGTYVMVGGSIARLFQAMLLSLWFSKPHRRKVKCLVAKPNQADLIAVKDLIEAGKIAPFIDRVYSLNEVPAAIRHLEQRQVRGKVVIRV
ncbi:NAD(P)-dependent alcohol dehydrogenase [Leptolyngbya sp. BC1307]|uniref:NAD(P)-dependent alcohol dehydrogenase n=1 Tax=Leptolyngbya sp. BC1307 TaxID=2029589 RepID=UPI000EFAF2ED|nr:NAD(P)-dependent alcohol dehydrogenase [Leptolyngbya sp. BC1307]